MTISLTVKYYRTKIEKQLQSYDLRVVIDAAVDMPEEIFVFQRGASPAPSAGAETTDNFICIADPVDLEDYPVSAPDLESEIPYYRLKEVTLRFRSMEILEEVKDYIAADLQELVDSLTAAANVTLMEEVTYA